MIKKPIQAKVAIIMTMIVFMSSVSFTYSFPDKITEKTREAVENASPDDWYTLAKSAEKCFAKKVNLPEAKEWLDRSIEISENAYNLGLKGDYYALNNLNNKAIEYYLKAIEKAKENDEQESIVKIQKKIAKITGIGG